MKRLPRACGLIVDMAATGWKTSDPAARKRLIRGWLWRMGVDVQWASKVRDVVDLLESRGIDLVLDVGANVGQYGATLRSKGYRGRIISFEPVHAAFQTLRERANSDGNWEVHNFALGACSAEAVMNVSRDSVFSSLLPATDKATELDTNAAVTHSEKIQVRALDDFAGDLSGNIFLKIDTQGYERNVLDGAQRTLPRLKGVQMELPVMQLYKGNWELHEALQYMAQKGFVPAQIHPVNYHPADRPSVMEIDCIFRLRD